jgi:hypothetical protein
MSTTITPRGLGNPDREARLAWIFFGSTFVALILNGVWTIVVGTALHHSKFRLVELLDIRPPDE